MEILMAIVIGVLFTCATYLILSKSILRIIIGTGLLSHGAHLLILTMGGLKQGAVPLLGENAETYVDPLPQAFVHPQPRSYVLKFIVFLSIILTKLTFIPFLNIGCVQK